MSTYLDRSSSMRAYGACRLRHSEAISTGNTEFNAERWETDGTYNSVGT